MFSRMVFQSTLPCGSDIKHFLSLFATLISIHAPLRERRVTGLIFIILLCISIHAPLRERLHINKIILHSKHFNPRSLAGATASALSANYNLGFQSTLPCGSDHEVLMIVMDNIDFNPRSLAGATAANAHPEKQRQNFNPRSLAGATLRIILLATHLLISIHAPLRERRALLCHAARGW